jgi:hypothetical protein
VYFYAFDSFRIIVCVRVCACGGGQGIGGGEGERVEWTRCAS